MNATLNAELQRQGFKKTMNEPCIHHKGNGSAVITAAVYVNDLLMMSKSPTEMPKMKTELSRRFKMKDLGQVKKSVGINTEVHNDYTKTYLTDYIQSLLRDVGWRIAQAKTCQQFRSCLTWRNRMKVQWMVSKCVIHMSIGR